MNPLIQALYSDGVPDAAEIDRFVEQNSFPLIEPGHVTFVYRGKADEVNLRRWIAGLSTAQPLQQLEGSDLWALTMELPEKSRFEYKYELFLGGARHLILDPLNDATATDPFGANSVCKGYGYERPAWSLEDPESRLGTIAGMRIESKAFGEKRDIQVYLPAGYRNSRTYPLLVVHDGGDYVRYADLKVVLDNLVHRQEIPPMIVALTQSPDRLLEYTGHDQHARFIGEDLVPALTEKFPLLDDYRSRGLMGASLGAVASLHTASLYPNLFGQLLLQSGSFAFSDLGHHKKGPVFDPVVKFVNAYRESPHVLAEKIYMSCGVYESLIYENRSLLPLLQAQGMQVNYQEVRDAHNWENWRDRLRQGLTWLFPGPLWMVYD